MSTVTSALRNGERMAATVIAAPGVSALPFAGITVHNRADWDHAMRHAVASQSELPPENLRLTACDGRGLDFPPADNVYDVLDHIERDGFVVCSQVGHMHIARLLNNVRLRDVMPDMNHELE